MYAVYEYWDITKSTPGGSIHSRHETLAEANAAALEAIREEAQRYRASGMTRASADAIIRDTYGDGVFDPDFRQGRIIVAVTREKLMHRMQHAYEVCNLDDAEQVAAVRAKAKGSHN